MKIAFDAKRITHDATGLGSYNWFIVDSLSTSFPGHTYQLYTPSEGKEVLWKRIEGRPSVSFHYLEGRFDGPFPSLWRASGLAATLRKEHVDLFHSLSNEIPMNLKQNGIPTVITIHDLVFLRCPQLYKPIGRSICTYRFRRACLWSGKVIAVSRQTMRDIRDSFHIPGNKIEVIYQDYGPIFDQAVQENVKSSICEKYQINGPCILCAGGIKGRKNLLFPVRALKRLKEDISVTAIDKHTPYTNTVGTCTRENNLSGRVHILIHTPFNELAAFYQMTTLFVYPSFFEGFGIPILEVQLTGTPMMATTGSCLGETDGSSALYADPRDEQELCDLIESVLNEPRPAEPIRSGGRENIWRFIPNILVAYFM